MNSHLPNGRRSSDSPPNQPRLWRFGLLVRKHPVVAGFTVAMVAMIYPVILTVGLVQDVKQNQQDVSALAEANARAVDLSFTSRKASSGEVCGAINEERAKLRAIIIASTEQSRPMERTFRNLGLPPYKERLRQAKKFASTIGPLNCEGLKAKIERERQRAKRERDKAR